MGLVYWFKVRLIMGMVIANGFAIGKNKDGLMGKNMNHEPKDNRKRN